MEEREYIVVKNYEMMIAGKIRIIPEIKLYRSVFEQSKEFNKVTSSDFQELALNLVKQLSNDPSYVLDLEEIEFFRATLKILKKDIPKFNTNEELSSWMKQFYLKNFK